MREIREITDLIMSIIGLIAGGYCVYREDYLLGFALWLGASAMIQAYREKEKQDEG